MFQRRFVKRWCHARRRTVKAFADCRTKINLVVQPAGFSVDLSGSVEIRSQGSQERFTLSMDARVPNGTTYFVRVDGNAAGTITIVAGYGELELNNSNGKTLPAGVSPVCGIRTIHVLDGQGIILLQGNF